MLGRLTPRVKVLEEFESHNREMAALIGTGYAEGTLDRFTITINHLREFIKIKFNRVDMEFADLDLALIKDFEFYLRTGRNNKKANKMSKADIAILGKLEKEIQLIKEKYNIRTA